MGHQRKAMGHYEYNNPSQEPQTVELQVYNSDTDKAMLYGNAYKHSKTHVKHTKMCSKHIHTHKYKCKCIHKRYICIFLEPAAWPEALNELQHI